MHPLALWLKRVYLAWFPWLNPCCFRVSVRLTTETPTATVPHPVKDFTENEIIRTTRHFEVIADSLEEAEEIALKNARLAFAIEGYHVRELAVVAGQEIVA
jgi:hypothetical protein